MADGEGRRSVRPIKEAYFGGKRLVGLYPRRRKLTDDRSRVYYQARVPYAGGRKLVSFGTSKEEAIRQFLELDRAFQEGRIRPQNDTRNTVQDLINVLLEHTKNERAEATYEHYQFMLRGFARRHGHRDVGDITPADVENEKRHCREGGAAPATINHVLTAINRVFNYAVKLGLIGTNPARNIEKVTKDTPKKGRPVSDDEMEAMVKACDELGYTELRDAIIVMEQTGLRIGELAQMTDKWIHWNGDGQGFIVIPAQADKTWRTRKDKQPRRIPMSPDVMQIVRAREGQEGSVFRGGRGGPFDKDGARKLWNQARAKAGIASDLTLHCLRHRFIIKARKAGMTYEQMEPITGNSAAIMRRYYSEWDEQDISEMMEPVFAQFNRWGNGQR